MSLEPPALDPAAQAFERLRLEVALLRRAVEGLAGEGDRRPPDYSPTLARLGKVVAAVDARVEALAAAPALELTVEQISELLPRVARLTTRQVVEALEQDRSAFAAAAGRLDRLSEAWRTDRDGWRRALRFGAGGVLLGAVAWAALLGPLARGLPAGWQVPERLAAATLAMPRAAAGERLLQVGSPERWRRMQLGAAVVSADQEAMDACLARAAKRGEAVRCAVSISPQIGRAFGGE